MKAMPSDAASAMEWNGRSRAATKPTGTQVAQGDTIAARELVTIRDERVSVPDGGQLVHMQFRRFAGCPVCNLHLRSVVQRHDEIVAAGIREVVLFHTSVDELRKHADELPFAVVADPRKQLYREFGVEAGKRAMLSPRAWGTILRAIGRSVTSMLSGKTKPPKLLPEGGRWGLPADILIAPDGRVLAAKYGNHAGDQWSVDELLALASSTNQKGQR